MARTVHKTAGRGGRESALCPNHRSTTCRSEGHSQPVTIEVNLRAFYFSSKTPSPIPQHQTYPSCHLRSPTDGVWAAICQQVQQDIFGRAVLPFRALSL